MSEMNFTLSPPIYLVEVECAGLSAHPESPKRTKSVLYLGPDRTEARIAFHESKRGDRDDRLRSQKTTVTVIADAGTADFNDDTVIEPSEPSEQQTQREED